MGYAQMIETRTLIENSHITKVPINPITLIIKLSTAARVLTTNATLDKLAGPAYYYYYIEAQTAKSLLWKPNQHYTSINPNAWDQPKNKTKEIIIMGGTKKTFTRTQMHNTNSMTNQA